jgi:hypothetical protein
MKRKQIGRALTRQSERHLIRVATEAIKTDFPNPERLGCPESTTLRAIAQRHLSGPDTEDDIDHIATCAPCFDEYNRHRRRHLLLRRGRFALICAAGVVAIGSAWHFGRMNRVPEKQPVAQQALDPVLAATLDFSNRTVERSGEVQRKPEPKTPHLRRAVLKLTIRLPIGTEDGAYSVQFWTGDDQPVATATGNAVWDGSAETLNTTIDLRNLAPGEYTLAIRNARWSWSTYRVFLD